jgi:hypothetical protein
LAWDTRFPRDLSRHGWVPKAVTLDLAMDPRYQGGAIGFALVPAVSTAYCSDAHYSVLQHNVRSTANEPYVTSVVYPSRKEPGAVYLAFEDGVMSPSDWTNAGMTDGDYNDYVAYVSGCFDDTGGGPDAGGAAGAEGAGAPNAAGAGNSGGGSANGGGNASGGSGGSGGSASGGIGTNSAEGGAAPEHGSSGDGTGGSSDGANASAGDGQDGSSSSSGSCGCRLGGQSASSAALLGCVMTAGWLARRAAWRRPERRNPTRR